ncbi:MAG: redoxin family protein [Candidatus Eremiobacteraeota bacterium]|nr:redoxin family protein [Candidatus Eremiobacteraeota bacterium]
MAHSSGVLPDLAELVAAERALWLNTPPLSSDALRGKVVLLDIWTYSCINSLRNLPYVQGWADKYKAGGLVVIGVHSPEFGFEKDTRNVEQAVRELRITFPIAIDSEYRIWRALNNEYWPADYFVDAKGRIRHTHFGEGDYPQSERVILDLLKENGATGLDESAVRPPNDGIEAPPSRDVESPETYVGYDRAENFASPEKVDPDRPRMYTVPETLSLNEWALLGTWSVGNQAAVLENAPGAIAFRFHSRDLHLVAGPAAGDKPVRFKVQLDEGALGADHGVDTAADGTGQVVEPRLYQLVRQTGRIEDRTLAIEFLDAGVRAYVFTFG